ncbi:MAG: DNA gyrase C-terminal beta-propeller domain-containing protein, partial [Tepidisphaeraceae bacterium]
YLLFFTNKGRVYEKRVFDVPEMSRTSVGRAAANLLEFQPGEKIANVLAIQDFEKAEQYLLFATARGVVKKTALSAYAKILTKGIIAIGLEEGDELIDVAVTSGHDHILLGTKSGLAIRFDESDVRAMGRPAGGVTGIRFKRDGDAVVGMIVIHEGDTANSCQILTACVNGFGKRTAASEYRLQGRGGSGIINIDASDRNGEVVGIKSVCDTDELMMITEKGILIRTRVNEIRTTGRNAQGVKLIRIDEGDRLVALAKIDVQTTEADKTVTEDGATGAEVVETLKHDAAEATDEASDEAADEAPDASAEPGEPGEDTDPESPTA